MAIYELNVVVPDFDPIADCEAIGCTCLDYTPALERARVEASAEDFLITVNTGVLNNILGGFRPSKTLDQKPNDITNEAADQNAAEHPFVLPVSLGEVEHWWE